MKIKEGGIKMDTEKIGVFLKHLRKENNMTQEQLGERIGVSNKTISRWENGNYMPPVDSLILLSDIYGISINEILSGEYVEEKDIKEVADNNVVSILSKMKKNNLLKKFVVYTILNTLIEIIIVILLLPLNGIRGWVICVLFVIMIEITQKKQIKTLMERREW